MGGSGHEATWDPAAEAGGRQLVSGGWGPSEAPTCPGSPVALPGVAHVRVVDAVPVSLLVQEVEHVLDGQGQGGAAVGRAEDGLEEVVHKLLQSALGRGTGDTQLHPCRSEGESENLPCRGCGEDGAALPPPPPPACL